MMTFPLLTVSWVLPLVGAVLLLLVGNAGGRNNSLIRWLALAVSLVTFAVTLGIWASFDGSSKARVVKAWIAISARGTQMRTAPVGVCVQVKVSGTCGSVM